MLAAAALSFAAASASASTAATATTALTAEDLGGLLDFLQGGFAVLVERARELQGLAGQWVVEIYGHFVVRNLYDGSHEMVAFAVHEGHFGTGEDVLVVEFAVNLEDLTRYGTHQLLVALAEGLCGLEGEVEGGSGGKLCQLLLEGFNHQTHSRDKSYGLGGLGLIQQLMAGSGVGVHLVGHLKESLGHYS